MTTDIFIRTYEKDLEWLKYCLRSISKFVTGYRNIIICIPADQKHLLNHLTAEKVYSWQPVCIDGYIDQQINKLNAWQFTDADNILFVDSDVCFKRKVDITEYFWDEKPIILKTRYELVGDAVCWKKPTEDLIGHELTHEYMRRLPLVYKSETIKAVYARVMDQLASITTLSEFNLVGAFADLFENEKYHFIDTEIDPLPEETVLQNWSWGGISNELKKELEDICS